MLSQAFYLRQAEICLALARNTLQPALRRRFEDLAIEFAEELEPDNRPTPSNDGQLAVERKLGQALLHARSH